MTSSYDHYPLVARALEEQALRFGNVPPEMTRATLRGLELIDTCVDFPTDQKESLMAVVVLMNCPPFATLKKSRDFTAEYNGHVSDMLQTHMRQRGIDENNIDLIQVYSALFVAHGENLLDNLQKRTPRPDDFLLRDIREAMDEYLADRAAYEHNIQPRLFAQETVLVAQTFDTLSRIELQNARENAADKKGSGPKWNDKPPSF